MRSGCPGRIFFYRVNHETGKYNEIWDPTVIDTRADAWR